MSGLFDFVGNFIDSLFGGSEERKTESAAAPAATPAAVTPVAPVVEAQVVMPLPDDDAVQKAKKRSIASQMARRGRQSTILSQNEDAVGGAIADAGKLGS